jgi:hypothetical protein
VGEEEVSFEAAVEEDGEYQALEGQRMHQDDRYPFLTQPYSPST